MSTPSLDEVCSYCGWIPYVLTMVPILLPVLALILHVPLLRLFGLYIRYQNGDKRELLLRASHEEAVKNTPAGQDPPAPATTIVGFFHPYCNAGGGGERVLWAAIHANQLHSPHLLNIVYTGDHTATKSAILASVRTRFDIHLDPSLVSFIYLHSRDYVSAAKWPRFTLAGQSFGSLILAHEAFKALVPDIYLDTMGYAFTVLMAKKLFAIPTGAYVHYPTISTDMLGSLSPEKWAKKLYWRLFAVAYSYAGRKGIDVVVANSSWTAGHLGWLWRDRKNMVESVGSGLQVQQEEEGGADGAKVGEPIQVLFPPCAVKKLAEGIPIDDSAPREKIMLYIAQFRPEKNHPLILQAFAKFLADAPPPLKDTLLVLIGSVREDQDEKKVYELRLQAKELGIDANVRFITNAPWPDIITWLGRASVGVNAMWNEHFGIGVVEYQAAGLIGVVHDSGGPRLDIVVEIDGQRTGFHATTDVEFAEGFRKALELDIGEATAMRRRARKSAFRFSEEIFEEQWNEIMQKLEDLHVGKKRR